MKKFKVYCKYITQGYAVVEAENSDDACELVELEDVEIEEDYTGSVEVYDCEEMDGDVVLSNVTNK